MEAKTSKRTNTSYAELDRVFDTNKGNKINTRFEADFEAGNSNRTNINFQQIKVGKRAHRAANVDKNNRINIRSGADSGVKNGNEADIDSRHIRVSKKADSNLYNKQFDKVLTRIDITKIEKLAADMNIIS